MREYVLAMRAIWDCWNNDAKLDFRGDFYSHTLMTPFFNPGRNPFGPPRVLLAGVGDVMTRVAGEVSDGFLCHGFTTERYLRETTLPALLKGRTSNGTDLAGFEIVGTPLVATGGTEEELIDARRGVRAQIAFYGSTPAYRPVLEVHGWGALGDELHAMSQNSSWKEMGAVIDDAVLNAFAVVDEPDRVAPELLRRYGDIVTRMTLYTPYTLDAGVAAQIVADVHAATSGTSA
jgi:probable F420-dependent oxidoreductase